YRPPPRWYLWTAFGVALAIHLTAVALAQKREAVAVELPPQPPQVVEATLAPPEATPPPEAIPLPEPPPPPEIKPEFVEARTSATSDCDDLDPAQCPRSGFPSPLL